MDQSSWRIWWGLSPKFATDFDSPTLVFGDYVVEVNEAGLSAVKLLRLVG
jgi:hypothetical protein